MRRDSLSYKETERQFKLPHNKAAQCERIYLEEGAQGLCIEWRGRKSAASGTQKARPAKLPKQVEEDSIAFNQRLRAVNDYLKNLHALVSERVRHEKNTRSFGTKA